MLKTIDLNKYIGLCESSISKELVKVNTTEDLYECQVVGDLENKIFLMVSSDNNYKLLGGLNNYIEKDYLQNTVMEVLSGRFIADLSQKI